METFYTEQDVRKIIEYACETKRANDYQIAGGLLIVEDHHLPTNSEILLDHLSDTDSNCSGSITMIEIHKLLAE